MGVQFSLVNLDKKETITFFRINTGTKFNELIGNQIAGCITNYYLLNNIGDRISFVDDTNPIKRLFNQELGSSNFDNFEDVTDKIIEKLKEMDFIAEFEPIVINEDENLYYRNLKIISKY